MQTHWLILTLILGILTGIGGGFGIKWLQAKATLREFGEALTAAGLCLITTADALDDDRLDDTERKRISAAVKDTGRQFTQAFAAAASLCKRE